jgi:hypothetical protein
VAGRAEPAALTGERQEILVLAVVTPDPGEPAFEVAAVEELVDDLGDDGAQEAVAGLVALGVSVQKRVKMVVEALPEWRCLGSARTIDLLHHADQCRQWGVSSNGIPFEKV